MTAPHCVATPGRDVGAVRRVLAQAAFETRTTLGNGEQLLLSLVFPLLGLLAVVHLTWIPLPSGPSRVDLAVPGVLAVAVLSTAFTGQAITTAFDRRNGVLRLLGTTPLGRGGLLAGRFLAVGLVLVVQGVLLGGVGLVLGWRPEPAGLPVAVLVAVLGSAAFLALGLLLGGTVRAEGVLAIANLVWVLLVAGGGVLLPAGDGPFGRVVGLLPSGALGDGLRTALVAGTVPWGPLVVLAVWTLVLALATGRLFRWS